MSINRRQLLQALGLGALTSVVAGGRSASAGPVTSPSRIVFFVQPHGHVPKNWNMPIPGVPDGIYGERRLDDLAPADFSTVLRPLHPFRKRMLAVEGLSHTSVLADIAAIQKSGGDLNNHSMGVAGLLTATRALQRGGAPCSGGSRSLDQELALRTAAAGRFSSRVYGADYVPNSTVAPFSFLGPGQASPIVGDPSAAFSDLLGYVPSASGGTSREELLRRQRPSVLDTAAREFDALAPKLGAEGRQRLEEHRNLVRELEASLLAPSKCAGSVDRTGHTIAQFMRLIRLAFSCDLTRVATFVAPVPQPPEIGYPAQGTIHGYAHQSIEGSPSCGEMYSPLAEQVMTDLAVWYAGFFAQLLQELDAVPEGSGTLLDHTTVVWVTELATPTHQHHDVCTVIAGGGNGFFDTGRYIRFPRDLPSPIAGFPVTGPSVNRLYTSLLQAMGQPDTSFGMTDATAADGTPLSLRGALTELHRKI